MSANSTFRDLGGERDPIETRRLTTPLYGAAAASGTVVAGWKLVTPDKCSITRIDVMWGTAGSNATGARQVKIKAHSMASGGSTLIAKSLFVGTMPDNSDRNFLRLLPVSAVTLPGYPNGIGFAEAGGTPTGSLGMTLSVYFTKGHVQP